MKTRTVILLVLLLTAGQMVWAQVSESLNFVDKNNWTSLYTFNYPSVGADGEEVVLSSALIAWTPNDRKTDDVIESVHIFSHITITSDEERPSVTTGGDAVAVVDDVADVGEECLGAELYCEMVYTNHTSARKVTKNFRL